ncbi:unnamed protein product, partial [Phaedon cochleariae]
KNVTAKVECSASITWSSGSSGSICSVKEEPTKYVNVCLSYDKPKPKPSLSLESRFSFDFDIDIGGEAATSTPITKQKNKAARKEIPPEEKSSSGIWSDTSILAEPLDNPIVTLESEDVCNFCRKNGEPEHVYQSHITKKSDGTVMCPILKKYVCELCGATGPNAHTRKYCVLYKRKFQPKMSMRRLSNGVAVSCFNHK